MIMENETSPKSVEEGKFTLIDSLVTAMFAPKEYGNLLRLKNGKIVGYVLIVVLLSCVIQYAIPALGSIAGLGGMKSIIMNEIPEFSLQKGEFYYEKKIDNMEETMGVYLLVDTTVDSFSKEDVPENVMQAMMVSKSNMIIYNSLYGMGGMVDVQNFEDFKDYTITNQTVADMSGWIYAGLAGFFVFLCGVAMVEYLCTALFYAAFLYILVKNMIQELTFGTVFKVVLFAQTIGLLVQSVTYCIGGELLMIAGNFFNVLVTVILMNKALIRFKIVQ